MQTRIPLVVLAALVVALPCAAQARLPQAEVPGAGDYVSAEALRPGDAIRITVWRKPELSGQFEVAADGTVAEPFYMDVQVAGVPFSEATARLHAHVARYETQPRVLVEPLYRVTVGGEVQRPDLYTFGRATSVRQAILLAGGPTARASLRRVWLHRGGERLRLNLEDPGDALAAAPIRSGDSVVVDEARPVLREYVLPSLLAVGAAASLVRVFIR